MQKRSTAVAFAVPHLRQKRVFDASGSGPGLAALLTGALAVGVNDGEPWFDFIDDRDVILSLDDASSMAPSGRNSVVLHHSLSSSGSM